MKEKTKNPVISFCIPTYSRPDSFDRLLRGVIPQLSGEIELLIRDDSPNEETAAIVGRLLAGTNINYRYVHGEKIGLDMANIFLIKQALGRYIWFFSDDDELLPGAISRVVSVLKNHPEISFAWTNFLVDQKFPAVKPPTDRFFENRDEVLDLLGTNIGLLSTLIVRKAEAINSLPIAKQFAIGMGFSGLVPPLLALSGSGKFYFFGKPVISNHLMKPEEIKLITKKNNIIKNGAFESYGVNFRAVILTFAPVFKKKTIHNLLKKNFAALWRGMLVGWVGGWDTPAGKRWKMFKLYWSFPEMWIALPIFLLPLSVNKFLYRIYKIFFSHRKWVFGKNIDTKARP